MKFKTLKTSVTGKKLVALSEKMDRCNEARAVFLNELGVDRFTIPYKVIAGGLRSVEFKEFPDMKSWKVDKQLHGCYMPRISSKSGKVIQKRFEDLPVVQGGELNKCIGFDSIFSTIGFFYSHPKYIGFEVPSSSPFQNVGFKAPNDCKEITMTEYEKLKNEAQKS